MKNYNEKEIYRFEAALVELRSNNIEVDDIVHCHSAIPEASHLALYITEFDITSLDKIYELSHKHGLTAKLNRLYTQPNYNPKTIIEIVY